MDPILAAPQAGHDLEATGLHLSRNAGEARDHPAAVPMASGETRRRSRGGSRQRALLAPLIALALAACATTKAPSPEVTGAIEKPVTQSDFRTAEAYWGERYEKDPKDRTAALNYAAALGRVSKSEQAVAVLERAVIHHPDDREVLAAYGKALAANGDLNRALEVVAQAQTPDRPDWRLLTAEGAILDQLGRPEEARRLHAQALALAPNEPSVVSNLGMSHLLAGDPGEAEKLLRRATAMPGADSRVRQNLALAVGLSGRFAEAEQIAGAELPPEEAAANVAYLKSMLSQADTWQALERRQLAAVE